MFATAVRANDYQKDRGRGHGNKNGIMCVWKGTIHIYEIPGQTIE